MGTTIHRTAFSAMVRESHDYSCVVMDADGRGLGQSDQSIPSFASLLPQATKRILRELPAERLRPGDVLITNDPWLGSSHLPDMTMVMPYFSRGRLIAFVGAIIHLPDIGGRLWASDAAEIYEEGMRLPLIYYAHEGELNREVLDLVLANVRTPQMVEGDLRAQASALTLGTRRLDELFAEYELPDLSELADQIEQRTDRVVAVAIAEVPEGVYESAVSFEGLDGDPVGIRVRLEVADGRIHADYSGSAGQSPHGLNCVYAYTYAYTVYALKCLLDPNTPNNDGCYRRFTVSAPEGSILNPRFPAAVAARHFAGHLVPVAVIRAFAKARPERVVAGGCVPPWLLQYYGRRDDDTPFTLTMALAGGQGGSREEDGLSTATFPTNSSNVPVEVVEATTPLRVLEKTLVDGSAGGGRRRGGLGQRVVVRNEGRAPVTVSILADQLQTGPEPLAGGEQAAPGEIRWNDEPISAAKSKIAMATNDVLTLSLPGGAGFGEASAREHELRARDLQAGYTVAAPDPTAVG